MRNHSVVQQQQQQKTNQFKYWKTVNKQIHGKQALQIIVKKK